MTCLCPRTQRRLRRAGLAGAIQTFLTMRTCLLTKLLEVGRGFWWLGVKGMGAESRFSLLGLKEASGSLPKVVPQKMG